MIGGMHGVLSLRIWLIPVTGLWGIVWLMIAGSQYLWGKRDWRGIVHPRPPFPLFAAPAECAAAG